MPNLNPLPTDQDAVLAAVVRTLVANLSISDRYVWETVIPLEEFGNLPSGDFWVTVSGGAGFFPEEFQAGGGAHNLIEFAETLVTGDTRIKLDSTDRDDKLLHDLKRGMYPLKKNLLKALVGQQLYDDAGNALLVKLIQARGAENPNHDRRANIGWVILKFSTPFQWNLSPTATTP